MSHAWIQVVSGSQLKITNLFVSGMLFTVFLKAKAPWLSLYAMHMRRYEMMNFKPIPVPQATPSKCWHGSCRHDWTIKMDGDVLALLEFWYYQTLETGMTVVKPRARCARHFAPRTHTKCISMTTMFVHTALLLCTRLYPSDQSRVFAECIFYALQVRTRTIKGFVCVNI